MESRRPHRDHALTVRWTRMCWSSSVYSRKRKRAAKENPMQQYCANSPTLLRFFSGSSRTPIGGKRSLRNVRHQMRNFWYYHPTLEQPYLRDNDWDEHRVFSRSVQHRDIFARLQLLLSLVCLKPARTTHQLPPQCPKSSACMGTGQAGIFSRSKQVPILPINLGRSSSPVANKSSEHANQPHPSQHPSAQNSHQTTPSTSHPPPTPQSPPPGSKQSSRTAQHTPGSHNQPRPQSAAPTPGSATMPPKTGPTTPSCVSRRDVP
jgi:hypothetical protein